jgi:hypothetical protein
MSKMSERPIDAPQPDRLMPLFKPWPPPPPITEAGLIFGTEVSAVVTRWLELADTSLAPPEVAKPRPRRLHRHPRREPVMLRRRRHSA